SEVQFDPSSGTFTFDPELDGRIKQLRVIITAVDEKGQTASFMMVIKIKDKVRQVGELDRVVKVGKLALSEQLRQADQAAGTLAELAALSPAFAASHAERGRA